MAYDFQTQVLIGTILGGSSLVKPPKGVNYYLSMRGQDERWLRYKMAEMHDFFKKDKVFQYGESLRCNSICCERLTQIKEELYDANRKKVTMELLDGLMDIGIAVWYLDGGSRTGRDKKNAYLNTTKFGEVGTEIVLQYFNEIGMPCNVNKDGKRTKVLFTVDGTYTLFKTIAHRFPTFMYHRIPDNY